MSNDPLRISATNGMLVGNQKSPGTTAPIKNRTTETKETSIQDTLETGDRESSSGNVLSRSSDSEPANEQQDTPPTSPGVSGNILDISG